MSSSTSTRATTAWCRCAARCGKASSSSTSTTTPTPLTRVPGRLREGPRGLPVPRDDRALQLPLGDQRELEAVHRRVHRVLPRADPAHEAGGEGGGREAGQVRLRGAGLRHQGRPLHGVVVGRHVAAEGPEHGQAHRADPAQRAVRTVGPSGHQGHPARRAAAGDQPGAATRPGAQTRSSSSPTSRCCSGRRAGT